MPSGQFFSTSDNVITPLTVQSIIPWCESHNPKAVGEVLHIRQRDWVEAVAEN
jgi:hypothetical protein